MCWEGCLLDGIFFSEAAATFLLRPILNLLVNAGAVSGRKKNRLMGCWRLAQAVGARASEKEVALGP